MVKTHIFLCSDLCLLRRSKFVVNFPRQDGDLKCTVEAPVPEETRVFEAFEGAVIVSWMSSLGRMNNNGLYDI